MNSIYVQPGELDIVPVIDADNGNDFFSYIKLSVDRDKLHMTNQNRIKKGKYGVNTIYYALI